MKPKGLKIGPTPGDEFEQLLFVLTQEVSFARLHLQIARGIARAASDKPRVLERAPVFFAYTFRAQLESAYTRAARLFDPKSGAATIPLIVKTAEQKAGKFHFATAAEVRKKVTAWENRIKGIQPLLGKLHDLRNGLMAHLDRKVVLDPQEINRRITVTFDEIEHILNVGSEILTSVLDAYINSVYTHDLRLDADHEALFRILDSPNAAKPKAIT
jgi:HEPN superfamily AbiU2-like protein